MRYFCLLRSSFTPAIHILTGETRAPAGTIRIRLKSKTDVDGCTFVVLLWYNIRYSWGTIVEEVYSFGYWVLRRRKALDLTRARLAQLVSCSPETIKKIERDERRPSRQVAELLADALAVPSEERLAFLQAARGQQLVDVLSLSSQPVQAPALLHNLPPQPTPFVDRERERVEINQLLTNPDCRLLTLIGPGGIGKTRLAIVVAQQASSAFAQGVVFVPLASVHGVDKLILVIANALNLHLHGHKPVRAQLLAHLGQRHLLLVLDSFEHLMEGSEFLLDVWNSAPRVSLLITSQIPLNIAPEWRFPLSGLDYPQTAVRPEALETTLAHYSALTLLVQRATQSHVTFHPTTHNLQSLIRICELVQGMPLGLELAASWVPVLSCQQIADGIAQNLDFLTTRLRDAPDRQRSLRAAFRHTWKLLSDEEQRAFRRLSVFRGGVTQDAARQVAGATLPVLAGLAEKSLINRASSDRYEIHELLRQFAHEQMLHAQEEVRTKDSHLAYYLGLVQVAERLLLGPEQFTKLPQLETEHDNLCAALDWCVHYPERMDKGSLLCGLLGWYWFLANRWREGYQWAERFLQSSLATVNPGSRAMVLFAAGGLAITLDDYKIAKRHLEKSIEIFRALDDPLRLAWSTNLLGIVYLYQGKFERAHELLQESLVQFQEQNEQYGYLWALGYLGQTVLGLGDYHQAHGLLQESLLLNRQVGYTISLPQTLIDLARVERCLDMLDSASNHLQECLVFAEELGVLRFKSLALTGLAWISLQLDNLIEAHTLFWESLKLYQSLGDMLGTAEALEGLGCIFAAHEDWQRVAYALGAAKATRNQIDVPVAIENREIYEKTLAGFQPTLTDVGILQAWNNGQHADLFGPEVIRVNATGLE